MSFFNFDYKKVLVFFFLVVIPLISANLTHDPNQTHWSLSPFSLIGQGIQRSYFKISSGVRGTTQMYLNLIDTKKKNKYLLQTNEELRAQLGALTELKLENQRFNKLLKFKKTSSMDLLATKVIASNIMPDHSALIIDKGYKQGIKKNMAAITPGGVVGYVVESLPKTSKVLLLTDRYMVVDAIIQRSRSRALLEGHSKKLSQLRHIESGADIKVGDKIVTSGLHKVFPKGFPVGQVINIEKGTQNTIKQILVKPAIDPYKTEELFVILNTNGEDLEPKAVTEEEELATIQKNEIKLQKEVEALNENNEAVTQ